MHPLPRKKRLLLTAEESEQWRNGTTEFRNYTRHTAKYFSEMWGNRCDVLNSAGTIVYSIRDGIPREDFATMCRDQYGKQCSVLNDAGRGGV